MRILVVANWKMNPQSLKEAKLLFNSVMRGIRNVRNVEVVICPPFLYISNLKSQISNLKLGTQNVFWEEKGAFTGEVSPIMLKNLGCQYVIVGHSERRTLGETEEMINKKIKAVLQLKLKPILCIGENEKERKQSKTNQVLKNQLKKSLNSILKSKSNISNLIVAYEPIWAIGTGNPCHPQEAKKVFLFLRKILKKNPILYGGSVNSQNAISYIKEANFNGLLVGGASLNSKEFLKIIKTLNSKMR